MAEERQPTFRPRARLLQMLGNELIGTPRLAVFELVKNAYDADASEVKITFSHPGTKQASIIVRDDGEGMDRATILNVWLEPGADYRQKQRIDRDRSKKFNRLPLGEKGVGRFAVHKLGNEIELRTKRAGHPEYTVKIDWAEYGQNRYMDQALVVVEESERPLFAEGATGTQVMVSGLHNAWTKGDVRRLWRNVKSISSPAKSPDKFSVQLIVPQHRDWLEGLLDIPDFLDRAMWRFTFSYQSGKFEWEYLFQPLPGIKVEARKAKSSATSALKLAIQDQKRFAEPDAKGKIQRLLIAGPDFTKSKVGSKSVELVGPVLGEFHAFDRDRPVLDIMAEAKSLTEFLDENGGVRVYRDGVRVHNYGERSAGDDWLGLDQRRVNIPARRLSNNILIGTIDLSLEESGDTSIGLIEKTNREGFVENEAFEKFRAIVLAALIEFENQRQEDKDRIRRALKPITERLVGDLENPISALRAEFEKRHLSDALGRHLAAIERKFNQMKEIMTHAGNAGLNLGILFHEIDRGVRGLTADIRRKAPQEELLDRAENLSQLLDGFSTLLRKDTKKDFSIKSLLRESKILNESRFSIHDIVFSCPPLTGEQPDFEVNASFGMLLGALSNLIDNALYWLQVRWPESPEGRSRALYLGTTDYYEEGPAIIIADNGPGLPSDISNLTQPFFTMKPDGMGLGLYYVNLVCELNNARLIIAPEPADVDIPPAYDGAAFAIVFSKSAL
jgi:signal transduction histidine kinase